ncbi:sulfatase [Halomarina litorea]|uniref:sulfatase n=1 Tax=Halomarina litorea TaxID=2961595 RepID=UPI0020C42AE2|nr:sulfatase [Halomarina sp. BCD28]
MTDDRPDIVLVSVDSLRADHCGFNGYHRNTTPNLDDLAGTGLVFENAVAPGPSTPESMPTVFTGHYPTKPEVLRPSGVPDLTARRERIRSHMGARDTLAERLSRAGYETAAFTPNPFTSRQFGFDAGFDHFRDFMDADGSALYDRLFEGFLAGSSASSMARILRNVWRREEVFKPWETYADEAVAWARDAEGPYFLWVFLMDAHNPYMAGADHRTQSRLATFHANYRFWRESHETPFSPGVHDRLVRAYDDSVRYADAFLAHLLAELTGREGRADPTVVVHADHGEAFGEHGTYGHEPYLYEENVRVPLVVADGSGRRVDDPVSLRRLPDLLAALAASEGTDALVESMRDPSGPVGPLAVSDTRQGDRTMVRARDVKYVREGDGAEACYTLADGERRLDVARHAADGGEADVGRRLAACVDGFERFRRTEAEKAAIARAATAAADGGRL